jgi:hypothetical protein
MPKYNLVDEKSDTVIGFAVINAEVMTEFQSVAPAGGHVGALGAAGPVAEGVLFLTVLGGSVGVILFADGPGWLAASVGLAGAMVVAGVRSWRAGTLPAHESADGAVTVQVEQVSGDGRHWVMGEFDESLTLSDLKNVAVEIIAAGNTWSRSVTTRKAGLSQGKHNKLQDDLARLWYIQRLPNNANGYEVTRQGRRFFEAVAALP